MFTLLTIIAALFGLISPYYIGCIAIIEINALLMLLPIRLLLLDHMKYIKPLWGKYDTTPMLMLDINKSITQSKCIEEAILKIKRIPVVEQVVEFYSETQTELEITYDAGTEYKEYTIIIANSWLA